jgi:hypothetical protein
MILVIILNNSHYLLFLNTKLIFILIILIKLNFYPINIWIININKRIDWENFILINFLIKIHPIILCAITNLINNLTIYLIISLIITFFFNFKNLKILITQLSINNMYWLILTINFSTKKWIIFILIYIWINFKVCIILKFNKLNYLSETNSITKNNSFNWVNLIFNLIRIPPIIIFLIKWMLIKMLIINFILINLILIINLFNQFFYIKLFIKIVIIFWLFKNWILKNYDFNLKINHINLVNILIIRFI